MVTRRNKFYHFSARDFFGGQQSISLSAPSGRKAKALVLERHPLWYNLRSQKNVYKFSVEDAFGGQHNASIAASSEKSARAQLLREHPIWRNAKRVRRRR